MMAGQPTNLQTSILFWISDEFFVRQSTQSLEAFTPITPIIDARFFGC